MNRASCLAKELYNWDKASDCYNNVWLYMSENYQWTISPSASSSVAYPVFGFRSTTGNVRTSIANYAGLVRPSVYLLSSTKILSGEGTPENPYVLGV